MLTSRKPKSCSWTSIGLPSRASVVRIRYSSASSSGHQSLGSAQSPPSRTSLEPLAGTVTSAGPNVFSTRPVFSCTASQVTVRLAGSPVGLPTVTSASRCFLATLLRMKTPAVYAGPVTTSSTGLTIPVWVPRPSPFEEG